MATMRPYRASTSAKIGKQAKSGQVASRSCPPFKHPDPITSDARGLKEHPDKSTHQMEALLYIAICTSFRKWKIPFSFSITTLKIKA